MNKLVYEVVLALLPVAFVIFLGWYAGYKKIIDNKHAESIAGYVMNFSFPAALFVLTASSRPSEIFNGKFVLAFWIGLLGMNIIAFFIYKMRRFSLKESGMGSFTCSVPDMTFMGIPIFTSLFGVKSLIAIAIGNVCYGLIMVPVLTYFLNETQEKQNILKIIKNFMTKPLIVAPCLGIIYSLLGLPFPDLLKNSLNLIGGTTSGVSLFTLGLIMSSYVISISNISIMNIIIKNILHPLIMAFLVVIFGVKGVYAQEAILLCALPTATISTMFALKYKVLTEEIVSSTILGTIVSIVTLSICMLILGL